MKTLSVNNLHFFDMPEGARDIQVHEEMLTFYVHVSGEPTKSGIERFPLPPGTWEAVGFVRELTEEQKKLYMEANRVYLKNPLGEKPLVCDYDEEWHQYQERVLPNAFLLIRK